MTTDKINKILQIKNTFDAPDRLMEILRNRTERERMFKKMLELFDYDLSFDWFSNYIQESFADSKGGQVFTPTHTANLMAMLLLENNGSGVMKDPCAGTGVLMIAEWGRIKKKANFKPSDCFFVCEELDQKLIPFLLFNLAVRGMNATVIHCDTMTRESWGAFYLQNTQNDPNGFSIINRLPYTQETEAALMITFANHYPEQIEI